MEQCAHGRGRCTWPDGGSYDGEFWHGSMHGEGACTWPSGRIYAGQWRDGKPHGKGSITEKDGSRQQGIWQVDDDNMAWVALEGSPHDAGGSEGWPDDASQTLVGPSELAAPSADASVARPKAPKKSQNKIPPRG